MVKVKNKRRIVIFFLILLLALAMELIYVTQVNFKEESRIEEVVKVKSEEARETDKAVNKELETYKGRTDKQGIVNISLGDNPYFLKKHDGYYYEKPKPFTYFSNVLNKEREALILLPKDFRKEKEYPYLIVLHGLHGSKKTWLNKNGHIIIQNLNFFENTRDMIVVFVDSNLNQKEDLEGLSFVESVKYFDMTEKEVMEGVIPALKESYNLEKGNKAAIVGQSLGGRNAMKIGLNHPEVFSYIGALGPAKVVKDGNAYFDGFFSSFKRYFHKDTKLFLCVGNEDTTVGNEVKRLNSLLDKERISYKYKIFQGGHNDNTWKIGFYNFLRIFLQKDK